MHLTSQFPNCLVAIIGVCFKFECLHCLLRKRFIKNVTYKSEYPCSMVLLMHCMKLVWCFLLLLAPESTLVLWNINSIRVKLNILLSIEKVHIKGEKCIYSTWDQHFNSHKGSALTSEKGLTIYSQKSVYLMLSHVHSHRVYSKGQILLCINW